MAERILFFESDPFFADQIKGHFEQLGVAVDVAADGPTGLQWAEAHPPQLILLTVELKGMNGFLVCKRIKKNDALKAIPLVILSSDATAETFEQHKKLRTRAEGYIHKPVLPAELQAQLEELLVHPGGPPSALGLPSEAGTVSAPHPEGRPSLVLAEEDEWAPSEPSAEISLRSPAVEDFTNTAFDSLMVEPPAPSRPVAGPEPPALPPPPRTRGHLERYSRSPSRPSSLPARLTAAPMAATAQVPEVDEEDAPLVSVTEPQAAAELEAKLTAAEHARSTAEERAVSAEKALAEAHRRGGATSREFLDLREQLNRKDRELLEIRDQIAARDKQLIEANDRSLTMERELADIRDEHMTLQRDAEKTKDRLVTLADDREGAKKREEDLKARLQRSESKLREVEDELEGAKAHYTARLEVVHRDHAAAIARLEADYAARAEELGQQRAQAEEALRGELVHLKEELDALVQERDGTYAKVEELTDRHRAELVELRRAHDVAMQHAVEDVRGELEDRLEVVTQVHRRELSVSSENYQSELAQAQAALAMAKEAHQKELSHLGRALSDADTRSQSLAERLEESESVRQGLLSSLEDARSELEQVRELEAELRSELERLSSQMAHDAQVVERVRRAMAIGLGLLDQRASEAPHHSST